NLQRLERFCIKSSLAFITLKHVVISAQKDKKTIPSCQTANKCTYNKYGLFTRYYYCLVGGD
ncbi:2027_t:CDS:1, partial [Funneliformis mosseae]